METMQNLLNMKVFIILLLCYKTIASQVVIEKECEGTVDDSLFICNPVQKDSTLQVCQEDEQVVKDNKIVENDENKVDQIHTQDEIEEINSKQIISCKRTKSKIISFISEKFKAFRNYTSSFFKRRPNSSKADATVDIEQPLQTCEAIESLESQE
ncbi:hypothetical protein CWI42_050010 [Ordospora colligata]|uniref:Uncharacterized protein n=1 Tax=Ordospora colligata OC4 TaxID=1354746 RepID=A0A0B2UKS1_9MICR|nr:uncharacterized protein M896_050030 [Ordospora colligata OC4]KHN69600.1 hypothetical protein M896_050030 [Ordospora colligata OC4]TBU15719.1 hypothetical protein CWI41_050020 [Ordospora colligata]TBU15847.1 hypothetical protein CWI40_050040 [Ordospora colligata]TBU18868.1 hypothetical protein CWI42_050010 [Ordospora colligata]